MSSDGSPPPLAPAAAPPQAPKVKKPAVGIGGWMILPIIGFFATIVLTVKNIIEAGQYTTVLIELFLKPETALLLKAALITSLVGGIVIICSAVAALIAVFRKLKIAPGVVTLHLALLLIVSFLEVWADVVISDAFQTARDQSVLVDAGRVVIYAAIWITYFQVSQRAKNTFVN